MYKHSKLAIKIFLTITITVLCSIILMLYISDPLRIYTAPNPNNTRYINDARIASLVIMKDHPFDSLIIGSSYSENTSSKEASELFDSNFLNLSLTGAGPKENYILLNYALKKYPVKNVIYTLGNDYLYSRIIGRHNYKLEDWAFLYDNNPFNDIKVYFNSKYFYKTLTFNTESIKGAELDIDRPFAWYKHKNDSLRFGSFDNWIKQKDNSEIKNCFNYIINDNTLVYEEIDNEYKNKLKKHLYDNLISIMKKYPNTNFYIIIPPISEIALALETRIGIDKKRFYGEKTLLELTKDYPNIKVYGFQDKKNFAEIDKYKDLAHFCIDFNSYFLKSINENNNQLTLENIDNYHNTVKEIEQSIDYDYYKKLIIEHME